MKKLFALGLIAIVLGSCGKSTEAQNDEIAENIESEPAAEAPTLTINEAEWVDTDLSKTAPMLHISVKLPKNAVLEKTGSSSLDVNFNEFYKIHISSAAVSNLAGMIADAKSLSVGRTDYYTDAKTLIDEPNGFVYTYKMKSSGQVKYLPESHFYFAFETKDKAYYSFEDNQSISSGVTGASYPAETAKKVYGIIKGSVKEL